MTQLVKCVECEWVSMGVSRQFALTEIAKFNEYYDTLSPEQQKEYYNNRKSSEDRYVCIHCFGTEFIPIENDECPNGVTVSAVIYEPDSD